MAKQLNEDARAEMSDLEQRADKGENITDEMFQAAEDKIHASEEAMAAAEARMEELKQDQVDAAGVMEEWVDRGLGKKIDVVDASDAEDAPAENAEKTAEIDDPEWEKFLNSYINDADFREIYTRKDEAGNDVFDEEACKGALRNMYEAKKRQEAEADKNEAEAEAIRVKNVAEIMAEDDAKNAEANPDDGFETAEQRGLFAKLKNFFKGNKRSKAGAERTLQQGGLTGFKRFAYAALMSLSLFVMAGNGIMNVNAPARNAANDAPDLGPQVVYAAEKDDAADDAKAEVKEDRLDDVAKDLSLEVDLNTEKGEELSDLVETTSYKENIEVNISYGDFDGTTEFLDYEEKHGQHNLTKELYGMSDESLTDVQKAEQIAEGLANVLDDPIEQGQFAALGGADVVIDGKTDGITKLADMNEVLDLAQQDNEFRIALADYNKEMYRDLVDNYDLQVEHREKGSFHYSLYAYEVQREDGTSDINYDVDRNGVIAQEDFDVLQFMDKDNQNVLDKNDIGGYKYNFLKGVGIIPEDATDEEAQDIMSKIRIIGFSGKCGQLIWENITPDTGDEGNGKRTKETDEGKKTKETDEKTTKETDEKTTKETDEKTTKETDEKTTKETDEKTTKETSEKTTKETEEKTTKETSEKTTKETSEKTTKETSEKTTKETSEKTTKETEEKTTSETEYDGKTDILPDDGGANIPMGPTQEETGPTTEAGDNVDNGGNGMVDDHDAGESSTVADDNFLNGGDTGGGTDDADGGGSNDADTEASYDGGDTSGYDNGADQESGTPSVDEGGSNNDSQADPGSDGSGEDRSGGADEAMDRIG